MFSNKNPNKTPETPKNDVKAAARKGSGIPSIISSDMSILGNIISEGTVDIDGHIEGNVKCHNASVRKNGFIKGDVVAEVVQVYGRIEGLIKARSVQFFKGCRVEGVIMHESITIEDGAYVDGRFKRTDRLVLDESEEDSDSDSEEKAPAAQKPETVEEESEEDTTPRFEKLLADEVDEDDEDEDDAKEPKRRIRMLDNLRLISDGN